MKIKIVIFLIGIMGVIFQPSLFAQKKLAQTGLQFLSVTPDARAAALANAMTTIENYSSALFSNPAIMSDMPDQFNIMLSQNNWIGDIKHNAFAIAFKPLDKRWGVFGISMILVDYGPVEGTIISNNAQGFLETGIIEPSAYAVGLGYAKSLTDRFSVGGQVKYVGQNLGPAVKQLNSNNSSVQMTTNKISVLAFDFGTVYKTGFRSLNFGMSVQNFSKEIKYVRESFQLPLTFNIGVSMNLADLLPEKYSQQHLLFTVDANHPRSHPEQVKVGLEYKYLNLLALRVGYISNSDEEDLSYGFGLSHFGFTIDYAYTPFGVFDKVQRFTLKFSI